MAKKNRNNKAKAPKKAVAKAPKKAVVKTTKKDILNAGYTKEIKRSGFKEVHTIKAVAKGRYVNKFIKTEEK